MLISLYKISFLEIDRIPFEFERALIVSQEYTERPQQKRNRYFLRQQFLTLQTVDFIVDMETR